MTTVRGLLPNRLPERSPTTNGALTTESPLSLPESGRTELED